MKPTKISTQSQSNGHWIPGLLKDCDLQYGIYASISGLACDVYCFPCADWVGTGIQHRMLGHMIETHDYQKHGR